MPGGSSVVDVLIALLALSLVFKVAWTTVTYRRLTHLRAQVEAAWAQVDVQLRRRHSLLTDLLTAIGQHAANARGALTAVADARSDAVRATNQGARAQVIAERRLTQALRRLTPLADGRSELAADDRFRATCDDLATAVEQAAYAGRYYNRAVQTLHGALLSLPARVVARLAGVAPWPLIESGDIEPQLATPTRRTYGLR